MPTDKEAIKRFLAKEFPLLPAFKAMGEAECLRKIKQLTGQDFKPKTWPRLYQLQGILAALYCRQIILFYDMQLGKTLCAFEWAEHLKLSNYWHGTGIVIAHAPVALDVWESQAEQHSSLKVRVVRTSFEDFTNAVAEEPDLIVMTWSGLQAIFCEKRPNRKGVNTLYANKELLAMAAECFNLFMIDEIHKAKDPWGLWFELAERISINCGWRIGLTGTPLNRDPYAIWAQLKLIDGGERLGYSFNFFKECFGETFKNYARGGIIDLRFDYKKMPILSARVATCAITYTREEAGLQVALQENVIKLGMHGDQLAAYEEAISDVVEQVNGDVPPEDGMLMHTFSKLRQISAGYLPFRDGKGDRRAARFQHSAKLDWLKNFIDELDDAPSVIIFAEHIECVELLRDMLIKRKLAYGLVYGKTTPAQDKKTIEAFQAGELQFFLANHQSAGTSITLSRADYLIFFESPVGSIARRQAQGRPLANRGDRLLTMIDLVCSPTDRNILEFIAEGKDLEYALRHAKDKQGLLANFKL